MSTKAFEYSGEVPAEGTKSFTIKTSAPTDIWRKPGPPEVSTFNAPIIYKAIPLSSFKRTRVTVTADWGTLYDQGGLFFGLPSNGSPSDGRWIKSGIEFFANEVYVSTVVKDRWADWSLVQVGVKNGKEVTLEIERDPEHKTLWLYVIDGAKKIPMREVTWALSEPEQEVWVGVYVAKPIDGPELVVEFKDWEVEMV